MSLAYGVLRYLIQETKCKVLFATHYHLLLDDFQLFKNVKKYMMDYNFDEQSKTVIFNYKFVPGMAQRSFAVNIAKIANLPLCIIEEAESKEKQASNEVIQIGKVTNITK